MPGYGLGIVVVILAALAIGCHESRCNNSNVMAELGHLPRSVVGTRAGFHANQARWQLREKGQQLRAIQPFANYDLVVLIGAMNTEHSFRQIDAVGAGGVHIIRYTV